MTNTPYALLFGEDELLNLTRRWILEKAGCTVLTAKKLNEVERLCAEHPVRVLILCPTELTSDCEKAIAAAERHRPEVKKLWLRSEERSIPKTHKEDSLLSSDAPHNLYLTMQGIVNVLKADGEA